MSSKKKSTTTGEKKERKPRIKITGTPRERFGLRLSRLASQLGKLASPPYSSSGTSQQLGAAQAEIEKAIGIVQALPEGWRPRAKRRPTEEQIQKMRERLEALQAKLAEVEG